MGINTGRTCGFKITEKINSEYIPIEKIGRPNNKIP